jgi:hypothetical protein
MKPCIYAHGQTNTLHAPQPDQLARRRHIDVFGWWSVSSVTPSLMGWRVYCIFDPQQISIEVRNWDIVAKALEAAGSTSSETYVRAVALSQVKLNPMPTSHPEAPYSISAIASWNGQKIQRQAW